MYEQEFANVGFITMPNGPEQVKRDEMMKVRRDKGLNVLEGDSTDADALGGANLTTRWEVRIS